MPFDLESFSSKLDWKQFEELANLAFIAFGYDVKKNFRLKKPRMEIDILAIKGSLAFGLDCKHRRRTAGEALLQEIADKQIGRCRRALRSLKLSRIVPVILTLRTENFRFLPNGVPVVPIHELSDFILNWENSHKILVIKKR